IRRIRVSALVPRGRFALRVELQAHARRHKPVRPSVTAKKEVVAATGLGTGVALDTECAAVIVPPGLADIDAEVAAHGRRLHDQDRLRSYNVGGESSATNKCQ